MPVLVGFVLGVLVTIFGAYMYDAATGNVSNGLSASNQAPMVNWNVVKNEWDIFESNVLATENNIERTINKHAS
jgi:hypothetical protein